MVCHTFTYMHLIRIEPVVNEIVDTTFARQLTQIVSSTQLPLDVKYFALATLNRLASNSGMQEAILEANYMDLVPLSKDVDDKKFKETMIQTLFYLLNHKSAFSSALKKVPYAVSALHFISQNDKFPEVREKCNQLLSFMQTLTESN